MSKVKTKYSSLMGHKYALSVQLVGDNVSHLLGKVLTIVDASTEGEKNKAMKDLIRQVFEEKQGWFWKLGYWKQEPDCPQPDFAKQLIEIK